MSTTYTTNTTSDISLAEWYRLRQNEILSKAIRNQQMEEEQVKSIVKGAPRKSLREIEQEKQIAALSKQVKEYYDKCVRLSEELERERRERINNTIDMATTHKQLATFLKVNKIDYKNLKKNGDIIGSFLVILDTQKQDLPDELVD